MIRKLLAVTLVLALLGAGTPARADRGTAGARPLSFLGLDTSARAAALGGAYSALADDAESLRYNPAGLGRLLENEVSATHDQHFEAAMQDHVALALHPGVAVSADIVNYGRVPRTTYASPDGGLGTFSITDSALSAGAGHAFGPLSLGAAGKWLREDNDGTVGQAVAADLGAQWRVPWVPGLSLAAVGQNLGGKIRFQGSGEALPATARAGAAWVFPAFGHRNAVAVDAFKEGSDRLRLSGGVETVAGGSLALRLGYTTRVDAGVGVTAGVGWRGEAWSADYAIAPYGDLGLTHRVSVAFRWGKLEEERPLREAGPDPVIEAALRSSRRREGVRPAADDGLPAEVVLGGEASPTAPLPAEERLAKARRLIDSGHYEEARTELDAADRLLSPEDRRRASWHELTARRARGMKDLKTARAEYMEALRLAIKSGVGGQTAADAYEGLGLTLAEQGEPAYAVRFLRKAYEVAPTQRLLDSIESLERRLAK